MRIILYYISKNALYARDKQSFDTFKNILWTTRTKKVIFQSYSVHPWVAKRNNKL